MSDLPGITIVTACLNSAATIQRTIDSVRAQEYAGPLEHIVVDGGSTDGTLDIVRRAGLRHISEPDHGLSDALNKGTAMARHEVLGGLNADDVYLPGALNRVGEAFAAHPEAEWLTGRCLIVDEHGTEIRKRVTAYKDALLRRWSYGRHLTHNFVSAPSTFVRRDALVAVGGYDLRFRYSMDYDLWLRLGRRGAPVVLDEPLAAFTMMEGTLSMSGFERQFAEHARNGREHGRGYPLATAANVALSGAIVVAYRLMRLARRASS
jgi:glycosyltransferase involved in cell wall biosynthesis